MMFHSALSRQTKIFICISSAVGATMVLTRYFISNLFQKKKNVESNEKRMISCKESPSTSFRVTFDEEYRNLGLRHFVLRSAICSKYLESLFPLIKANFLPQKVIYNGGVEWSNSCYMDIAVKMKPSTEPHLPLYEVCTPLLLECDRLFSDWYCLHHGGNSIKNLTRLQSFITRYRPQPGENQLARHVDGRNVHGSLILGLPTDEPFEGGGVTVWDGRATKKAANVADNGEGCFIYPILPGDVCCLDRLVWHQGNPITAGRRWVLVIFYAVQGDSMSRADSRERGLHQVNASSVLQSLSWIAATGSHGMQLQGGDKFEQSRQGLVAHPVDMETRALLQQARDRQAAAAVA